MPPVMYKKAFSPPEWAGESPLKQKAPPGQQLNFYLQNKMPAKD